MVVDKVSNYMDDNGSYQDEENFQRLKYLLVSRQICLVDPLAFIEPDSKDSEIQQDELQRNPGSISKRVRRDEEEAPLKTGMIFTRQLKKHKARRYKTGRSFAAKMFHIN